MVPNLLANSHETSSGRTFHYREDGMNRHSWSSLATAVLGLTLAAFPGPAGAEETPTAVKIVKTWEGEVRRELRKEAPQKSYIVNNDAWAKLWKAYRGEETLPKVDFDKEMILVAVNTDPNQIEIHAAVDDRGDMKITYASTLVGFIRPETCAYQFALIKRDGIQTIRGKPISND